MPSLRPTVPDDLSIVSTKTLPHRLRFLTMHEGDDVLAVGGLIYRPDGTVWVSAVITPAGRKAAITLHRAGLRVMREARARGVARLFALADPTQPRSEAWLKRCGFVPTDMHEHDRRVWSWTA